MLQTTSASDYTFSSAAAACPTQEQHERSFYRSWTHMLQTQAPLITTSFCSAACPMQG